MSLIIGILGRPNKMEREIYSFSKAIVDVIIRYEAVPLGIMPSTINVNNKLSEKEKERLYELINLCDGIILQGGSDYYDYDMEAIKYINKKDIPLLGICLGMQSLAAATNGKIESDKLKDHKKPGLDYAHSVKINKDSKFYTIINKEVLNVNSIKK